MRVSFFHISFCLSVFFSSTLFGVLEPSVALEYPAPPDNGDEEHLTPPEQSSEDERGLFHEPSVAYDYPAAPGSLISSDIPVRVYYNKGIRINGGGLDLSIGGDIQIDGRFFFTESNEKSSFRIRRARIAFQGTFEDFFGFSLVPLFITTASPFVSGVVLQFAYIETLSPEYARFRFGLFKEPFSLEALYPDLLYEFDERSLGILNFARIFDIGLMSYGSLFNGRFVYGLGVFNGNGVHLDNNTEKAYTGRIVLAPFLHTKGLLDQLYFGFSASVSRQNEDLAGTNYRTGAGTIFWKWKEMDYHSVRVDDNFRRLGCDMEWYYGSFVLRSEYLYVNDGTVKSGHDRAHFQIHSGYVEGIYVLTGEEKVREGWVIPKHNFPKGWGAWEIAARYEFLTLDPMSLRRGLARGTSRVDGLTLALNIYFNSFVALKIDWEHFHFKQKVHLDNEHYNSESAIIARLQAAF